MMTLKQSLLAITTTAALALGASANASIDLVTNGGFETGDLTGWTTSGGGYGVYSGYANTGSYGAYAGSSATSVFSQTLATTAGQSYTVDFWLGNFDFGDHNAFSYTWGGVTQVPSYNTASFGYREISTTAVASSASTVLSFTFESDFNLWKFDDVSVTPSTAPAPVPLPAALWLFGPALMGLAGLGYKRKQSAV